MMRTEQVSEILVFVPEIMWLIVRKQLSDFFVLDPTRFLICRPTFEI